jgi:hypothetical protein
MMRTSGAQEFREAEGTGEDEEGRVAQDERSEGVIADGRVFRRVVLEAGETAEDLFAAS